jgi:hypothetical protein
VDVLLRPDRSDHELLRLPVARHRRQRALLRLQHVLERGQLRRHERLRRPQDQRARRGSARRHVVPEPRLGGLRAPDPTRRAVSTTSTCPRPRGISSAWTTRRSAPSCSAASATPAVRRRSRATFP